MTSFLLFPCYRFCRCDPHRRGAAVVIARAVASSRQRLERRFRAVLGRTVLQQVRRAHVEIAKRLLSTTSLDLSRIAQRSGFGNAALLNVAFRKEMGVPPGVYRRRVHGLHLEDD